MFSRKKNTLPKTKRRKRTQCVQVNTLLRQTHTHAHTLFFSQRVGESDPFRKSVTGHSNKDLDNNMPHIYKSKILCSIKRHQHFKRGRIMRRGAEIFYPSPNFICIFQSTLTIDINSVSEEMKHKGVTLLKSLCFLCNYFITMKQRAIPVPSIFWLRFPHSSISALPLSGSSHTLSSLPSPGCT